MRLPGFRYEQIKGRVTNLYKWCGCDTIPVNPLMIAEKLDVAVIRYSSLGEDGEAAALKKSPNGFKFLLEKPDGSCKRYVYFNDRQSVGRCRFTLLHEIGHIVLGHLQESEVAEAEANFFAKFAIAPPSLVHIIRPADYMDISDAFGLSEECALNSWNYYHRWLRTIGDKPYEKELSNLFVVTSPIEAGNVLQLRRHAWGGGRVA